MAYFRIEFGVVDKDGKEFRSFVNLTDVEGDIFLKSKHPLLRELGMVIEEVRRETLEFSAADNPHYLSGEEAKEREKLHKMQRELGMRETWY